MFTNLIKIKQVFQKKLIKRSKLEKKVVFLPQKSFFWPLNFFKRHIRYYFYAHYL